MEENTFLRPEVNARREKRGTYRDGDPGVGGGRPPRTIYDSSNVSKGYFKGYNAQKQRKGEKAKLSLARRAKMTKPLRYPKNTAPKLSVTYGADFVEKKSKEARSPTKLPGIKSATPRSRPKTTPVKPFRSAVQPAEFRTQPIESRTRTTIDLDPVDKESVKKKRTRKKKFVVRKRRKSSKQNAEILEQQLEQVSHGRYISIRGSLKLGSNKIKIAIEDITSGAVYKTSFELDEEAAQTAQDDTEQGNRMLRVVVLACDLVPNRDKNGLRKKKAWSVEINPIQLQAALEVNHEMDEQVYQNQMPTPTRRAATASRDRRAREHTESDQEEEEDEFEYFNERACPPTIQLNQSRKFKPQTPQHEKRQRPLSYKTDMSMDAPPFRTKIDDIVFKCVRELDYRSMNILVAYRPLDGSITLQANDPSIDHYWRLVVRTRPKEAPPGADDGLNNRDIKEQLQALEGLVGMLEIRNTSDYSLGKLELNMFDEQ